MTEPPDPFQRVGRKEAQEAQKDPTLYLFLRFLRLFAAHCLIPLEPEPESVRTGSISLDLMLFRDLPKRSGQVMMEIVAPPNTTATVDFPDQRPAAVLQPGAYRFTARAE